jgi:hypothetical protein
MLRCPYDRPQTPFQYEGQLVQAVPLSETQATHSPHKSGAGTTSRQQGAYENNRQALEGTLLVPPIYRPPSIALSLSSSSTSSVSSTSATIDVGMSSSNTCPPMLVPTHRHQQHHVDPWYHHPPHYSSHHHSMAHCDKPRGMILASPPPETPPPARVAVGRKPDVVLPPKLYRVTLIPTRGSDDRFSFTPLALDGRYSDQDLQELQDMRTRASVGYHPNHYCPYPYPPPPSPYQHPIAAPSNPRILSGYRCAPEVIGSPSLRIYRLRLPSDQLERLDRIIEGCEAHAKKRATGWHTDLYSLTRQDLALADIPGMMDIAMPILHYLSRCICEVYHAESVKVDRNQPHVLKYNDDHTGVQLHHDRCDVTANLMMSRSHTYAGGG